MLCPGLQKLLYLVGAEIHTIQLVDRIQVDRYGHQHTIDACEYAVFVRTPGGKLT